jgi:AsmA protein
LIAIAVVLALVVGAGVVAAVSFDPNSQKQRIADAVRRATGRELQMNGPLHIQWGLTPELDAEDVSFANMADGTRPQMAVAARVAARLRLASLLSGQVEVASVTLIRPDILLETDAAGRGNWQFDRPQAPPAATAPTAAPSSGPRLTTVVDSLRVEAGRVAWHDGTTGRTVMLDVPQATLDLGAGPAKLLAQAKTAGVGLRMDAVLGTQEQITGHVPFPLTVHLAVDDATVTLDGAVDPSAHAVSGQLTAAIPDLARFGTLLQRPLPPLRDVHVSATLPGGPGLPQDITLHAGQSDLGSMLPGATITSLDLRWPAAQPARLEASGTLSGAPWHVATGVVAAGGGVALRAMSLTSGLGDVAGDAAVRWSPRPSLRGTVVSTRLDLDAIRALVWGVAFLQPAAPVPVSSPPASPPGPSPAQAASPPPRRIFSDAPLPWGVLRRVDADLQLTIGALHGGGADYSNASGHLVLDDGALRIDPASVRGPEGQVDFSLSADARQAAPPVALALRSGAFAIDPLLQALGLPGGSDATAEVDVAVHAAGASPHALAASLDGHAGLAVVDGDISNAALLQGLGEALRTAGAGLDPKGRSHLRCLAIRADAQAGQVTVSALKLDTPRLLLEGTGTLNLADETMDWRLRPFLRLGAASVLAPLHVAGPIVHPAVAMDAPRAGGRAGVIIGGAAGAIDARAMEDCAPELTAARDGRPGAMPAAAATKPVKPADLLRSLLR